MIFRSEERTAAGEQKGSPVQFPACLNTGGTLPLPAPCRLLPNKWLGVIPRHPTDVRAVHTTYPAKRQRPRERDRLGPE